MTQPLGKNLTVPQTGDSLSTPSRIQTIKKGVGDGINSMTTAASEWTAVKTVRNSVIWNWITWPFSAVWARISGFIWRKPSVVTDKVSLEIPGWFYGTTIVETSPETALRNGYLTVEQGIAKRTFNEDQAKINGWVLVEIPGRMWGSSKMMLKDAILGGYITVEDAIKANYITESLVEQADWVKKTTST
jgi:hypothetical protein